MRFAFIRDHRDEFRVTSMCRVLRVSRSGFHAWLGRPESDRAREDRRLTALIQGAFDESRRTYGSPRHSSAVAGITTGPNYYSGLNLTTTCPDPNCPGFLQEFYRDQNAKVVNMSFGSITDLGYTLEDTHVLRTELASTNHTNFDSHEMPPERNKSRQSISDGDVVRRRGSTAIW